MTSEVSKIIHQSLATTSPTPHNIYPCMYVDWRIPDPESTADGLVQGIGGLVDSVAEGFTDVLVQPVKGIYRDGVQGAATGVVNGIVKGLVSKTYEGGSILLNKVATGFIRKYDKEKDVFDPTNGRINGKNPQLYQADVANREDMSANMDDSMMTSFIDYSSSSSSSSSMKKDANNSKVLVSLDPIEECCTEEQLMEENKIDLTRSKENSHSPHMMNSSDNSEVDCNNGKILVDANCYDQDPDVDDMNFHEDDGFNLEDLNTMNFLEERHEVPFSMYQSIDNVGSGIVYSAGKVNHILVDDSPYFEEEKEESPSSTAIESDSNGEMMTNNKYKEAEKEQEQAKRSLDVLSSFDQAVTIRKIIESSNGGHPSRYMSINNFEDMLGKAVARKEMTVPNAESDSGMTSRRIVHQVLKVSKCL